MTKGYAGDCPVDFEGTPNTQASKNKRRDKAQDNSISESWIKWQTQNTHEPNGMRELDIETLVPSSDTPQ